MSLADTEKTIRGYMDEIVNGGDFASYFSDDVVWTTMETGDQTRGRDAVRHLIIGLHSQWFEATVEPRGLMISDGLACLEAVFIARQIAEFAGVPATGAEVRLPYAIVYDIDGSVITALRAYFPITALMHQLREASDANSDAAVTA